MNKITEDSVRAFMNGQRFKRGNMEVHIVEEDNSVVMRQHGNRIAWYYRDDCAGTLELSNAGWWSATTKARLNEVLGYFRWRLCSVKGDWVLWTRQHGEQRPFHGSIRVADLLRLDHTIYEERRESAEEKAA